MGFSIFVCDDLVPILGFRVKVLWGRVYLIFARLDDAFQWMNMEGMYLNPSKGGRSNSIKSG